MVNSALASLQLANNETGVIQPVAVIAELARANGCRVHTDATQAVGRMPVSMVISASTICRCRRTSLAGRRALARWSFARVRRWLLG